MRVLLIVLATLAFAGAVHASGAQPAIQHRDPTLSPDGRLIAYLSLAGRNQRGHLMVMRADGTHTRRLAPARAGKPWWSPDGKLIAYVDRDVYVVSPTGGRSHRLTQEYGSTGGIVITGWIDARTIAYQVNDCCIVGGVQYFWEATVTLGGEQVDHDSDAEIICNISVTCGDGSVTSPDGTRVVTTSKDPDGTERLQLSGAGLDPVDLGAGCCAYWADRGRRLVWHGPGLGYLWIIADANGADRHELTWNGVPLQPPFPEWSPDGKLVGVIAKVNGKRQVFVGAGNGADLHPITSEPRGVPELEVGPLWSAHGRWLLYPTLDGRAVSTMAIAPDGSQRHVLVGWRLPYQPPIFWDETWYSLDWAAGDASAVYYDYTGCGGSAIYRVSAATGRATRLTNPCPPRR
jgi:Tol biopolymer transport system component